MKLAFDVSRCNGHYIDARPGFGRTLDSQCIDCARRLQTENGPWTPWMSVEVMRGRCEHKIKDEK